MLRSQTDHASSTTNTATGVVEQMIRILEDDPVTNAGTGSNLNLDGRVECDASIMNGTTLGYGSVGAVSDFKNPISVAAKILHESDQGPLSLGRIPPIMLVGSGAMQWVDTMGFSMLERVKSNPPLFLSAIWKDEGEKNNNMDDSAEAIDGSLVTRESLHQHVRFQVMLQKAGSSTTHKDFSSSSYPAESHEGSHKRKSPPPPPPSSSRSRSDKKKIVEMDDENWLQDTVGAICVDGLGRVAAGAAVFGAGCWAQDPIEHGNDHDGGLGFACSMTGAGEQICKTLLARTCMETFVAEEPEEDDTSRIAGVVLDRFLKSPLLRSYNERHAGFIAVKLKSSRTEDCGSVNGMDTDEDTDEDTIGVAVDSDSEIQRDTKNVNLNESENESSATRLRAEFVFAHTTKTMV
ncbi:hypothetical protein BGZ58_007017 [Dissophora ornata]|nr:hypothetical protein BGZ58_007017 [Dissophora ornata]